MEVRTPSDGFAATFPKGDGFYPAKLKFIAQFTARAVRFQSCTAYPGIGVATRLNQNFSARRRRKYIAQSDMNARKLIGQKLGKQRNFDFILRY